MSLRLHLPDGHTVDIERREDVMALAEELAALGDKASASVADSAYASPHAITLNITESNIRSVARALDHLRNAIPQDFAEIKPDLEIIAARDAVLMRLQTFPLTYRLRSWVFNGKDEMFWSYTGTYEEGGRLVAANGEVFTILTLERQATPVEDGVILVDRVDH